ncbi:hypothetical protein ASPZODRAFT_67158 [Penicilliopsis zonata CBS 506.65]|uniref:PEBP-like protein n=1 Tax=Penicilliopsis zonata CBS 506.65 TaxID=1073090 RepID=A0A1L9SG23_9EURO|nr:hypothetical protein ASPZODRAFT_67158 [Penicilliopsis zonata CBS 506.65]OJJ46037.1 hypothetical protein ASPZODRAFT_67158 [Penicilliopsis zonata CBS 506.65]
MSTPAENWAKLIRYNFGRMMGNVRAHEKRKITNSLAFMHLAEPNMLLEAFGYGPSGSPLMKQHTCLAPDGKGRFPELHWTRPLAGQVKEYVLVCEDLDTALPGGKPRNHCLLYNIPGSTITASHLDLRTFSDDNDTNPSTSAGWKYVAHGKHVVYVPPKPLPGHGAHRYVYTVIALDDHLVFPQNKKVTKEKIMDAMTGKVIGWGQWVGQFERPYERGSLW